MPSNGNPGFVNGQKPDASVWDAAFTAKVDAVNGYLQLAANAVNPLDAVTLQQLQAAMGGGTSFLSGIFDADGAFGSPLPATAIIIGGRLLPTTGTGLSVSIGTSLGASDVLPLVTIPGSGSGPTPLLGTNFLLSAFGANQQLFAHSPSWAPVTITLWYLGP